MFILKKILSPLLQPLSLGLEIILCGLILLCFTRHRTWGRNMTAAGTLIILMLSLAPVSDLMLRPLEHRNLPFMNEAAERQTTLPAPSVSRIVVLGGGATDDPYVPLNSRLGLDSIARLTEAVRLYRRLPGSRIILSGGSAFGEQPEAEVMAETARTMGVPLSDLLLETKSRDTEEQAIFVRPLVETAPFLLVTSAYHMPRSIALFQKQGMAPIPAPTAFAARTSRSSNPGSYFPNASSLQNSERALHEYLGLFWSWLRGAV